MKIHCLTVGPLETNCYILSDKNGNAVAIDPGADSEAILSYITGENLVLREIWLTHAHFDHAGAIPELKKDPKVVFGISDVEAAWLKENIAEYYFLNGGRNALPPPEKIYRDKEILVCGELELQVLLTPGHTPGGVCFYSPEGHLFSGDTLFAGGIGRSDFPGGNHRQLITSIREKLLCLPGSTRVYPGHGPDTDLETEAKENPFLNHG